MPLHSLVAAARARLRAARIPSDEADLDARLLAEHVLGWDAARYFTHADEEAPAGFADRYDALVARRAAREPVAYIVGRQEFWVLSFEVSPAVLIPRPETELLVEAALERVDARRVVDVGTGSGCIAVAIAHERRDVRVVATDSSSAALDVARRNASTHGVADRISFAREDLFDGLTGAFDLIVSNPPYVPDGDRASLQPEVRDFEPGEALFAGADGLDVIRALVAQAPGRLTPGGALLFEFGFGQADAVASLLSGAAGLTMLDLRRDLQGIPRVAIASRE